MAIITLAGPDGNPINVRRNEMSYGNEIEVNGVVYVKKEDNVCCEDCCQYDCHTAPEFVDADGKEVVVGSEVRVRLSRLEDNNIDRDNRHGVVIGTSGGGFNVKFNHRQRTGDYTQYFFPTSIRLD